MTRIINNKKVQRIPNDLGAAYSYHLVKVAVGILMLFPYMKQVEEAGTNYRVLPLDEFVAEILRRTKISYATLIAALLLLERLQRSLSAISNETMSDYSYRLYSQLSHSKNFIRRIFICSVVIATKYLHDRHPTNSAWSELTGLSLQELNYYEVFFLTAINHDVYISMEMFYEWSFQIYNQFQHLTVAKPLNAVAKEHPSLIQHLNDIGASILTLTQ